MAQHRALRWIGRALAVAASAGAITLSPGPFAGSGARSEAEEGSPAMPGPGPRRRSFDAAERNLACEGCHKEIADEWRSSLHRQSHTDPVYARAFAREPLPFCQSCHAPEADPRSPPPPRLSALGVGCVTCHVSGEDVLAAPRPAPDMAATGVAAMGTPALHLVKRPADFAGDGACVSCHEFMFPEPARYRKIELMQSTVSEHRASAYAGASCASCHMPLVEGGKARHKSHVFAASRDASLIRSAVRASATRRGPTSVRVLLVPGIVGHAAPTGDLFRRIEVLAEALGEESNTLAEASRFLTRHFGFEVTPEGKGAKVLRADDRVGAAAGAPGVGSDGSVTVDLELGPAAAGRVIAWRVAYQRVEQPMNVGGDDAVVEGEIVIAEGTLSPR